MTDLSRRNFITTGILASAAAAAPIAAMTSLGIPDLPPLAPPPERPYQWHVSFDGGYIYEPCATRAEAVRIAKTTSGGATIAECQQQDYYLDVDGNQVLEMLHDQNGDLIGEGDFIDCTDDQAKELGDMVSKAISEWAAKHKIDTTAWQFGDTRHEEHIPESPEYAAERARRMASYYRPTPA